MVVQVTASREAKLCFRRGPCPCWLPLDRELGQWGLLWSQEWPSWQTCHMARCLLPGEAGTRAGSLGDESGCSLPTGQRIICPSYWMAWACGPTVQSVGLLVSQSPYHRWRQKPGLGLGTMNQWCSRCVLGARAWHLVTAVAPVHSGALVRGRGRVCPLLGE